jgi:two-component system NtrC family sensor kinase
MTVQFRLIIRFIVVILVAGVVLATATGFHLVNILLDEVQGRVNLNLNSAQTIYENHAQCVALFLRGAALDPTLPGLLAGGAGAEGRLKPMEKASGVDRFYLLDKTGKVIASTTGPQAAGQDFSADCVVRHALKREAGATGTVLVPVLQAETRPAAAGGSSPAGAQGSVGGMQMALAAAAPVHKPTGEFAGLLYGVRILNDDTKIVDAIRYQVFQFQFWRGTHTGTATLFQNDVRICTNVRSGNGRALGTRMTPEVYRAVLVEGKRFAAKSYEVNDEYLSAYEPIRNPDGVIVGALSVGVLRAPFVASRDTTIGVFLATLMTIAAMILVLLIMATRQVLRPIDRVIAMTDRVVGGDLSARVGIRPAGDLGRLCAAVDRMAEAVVERETQLEQATRRQISQSERLAAIGRLAAGVAHEVNNPLTGVLTFTHLLRAKPNLEDQDRADLDLVIRETTRVRDIVRGLLDFARETPSRGQWLDVNELVRQAVRLLAAQEEFGRILMEERLGEKLPQVYGDPNQLQQVFLNLSLNACESMPEGGRLTIATELRDGDVAVVVSDTGCGIRQEDLERIFEPFFTTKPVGKGTGLGLSVSYGIVQQHGGTLGVKSSPGRGTTFTILLRSKPREGEGVETQRQGDKETRGQGEGGSEP